MVTSVLDNLRGPNDLPDVIVISTKNVDYTLDRDVRYGFYRIKPSKGAVPKILKGTYTDVKVALQALNNYLANLGKETVKEA